MATSEQRASMVSRLAGVGFTIAGLVAAISPLLLWMSWSITIYYLILLSCFSACVCVYWFAKYMPEHAEHPPARRRQRQPDPPYSDYEPRQPAGKP